MCVAVGICSQLEPFSVGALVFYKNEGCARILSIDSASQPPTYQISFVLGDGCGATDLERSRVKHADLELYDHALERLEGPRMLDVLRSVVQWWVG